MRHGVIVRGGVDVVCVLPFSPPGHSVAPTSPASFPSPAAATGPGARSPRTTFSWLFSRCQRHSSCPPSRHSTPRRVCCCVWACSSFWSLVCSSSPARCVRKSGGIVLKLALNCPFFSVCRRRLTSPLWEACSAVECEGPYLFAVMRVPMSCCVPMCVCSCCAVSPSSCSASHRSSGEVSCTFDP